MVSFPLHHFTISIMLIGVVKRSFPLSVLSIMPVRRKYLHIYICSKLHEQLNDLHTSLYNEGEDERQPEQA